MTNFLPVRLTAQYARGAGGGTVAKDAKGRIWYRNHGAVFSFDDQDVPVWPPCVACGRGVDWLHVMHWSSGIKPTLYLHAKWECVTLVYPK